jgi:predicted transcriptional regulator
VKNKVGIKKSQHHFKDKIKRELETVYITTSGDRFLKEMDALCAQSQIQQAKESKEKRRKKIMNMVDILMNVLKENNWGVFYKSEPMQTLTLQDDAPLLKINEVDSDSIESAVLNVIEQIKLKDLKDWAEQEKEDTTPPLPTDSSQTNS